MNGRWVKCPLHRGSHGNNDWMFLVVPGSLPQVAPQLWNSNFSVAVAFATFPASMEHFQGANSPSEPISLGEIETTAETAPFFEACVQGVDVLVNAMTGPRHQGRQRRRRLNEVRKDFTSMLAQCAPGKGKVWEAIGLSVQSFLENSQQTQPQELPQWDRAQQYFTAASQTWAKGVEPGFQNPSLTTAAGLDILRSMLRRRMWQMVEVGEVAAVHSGYLTKHKTHLKLFVPLGQINSKNYEVQTWSQRMAWVARRHTWEEALRREEPLWDCGEVFLVDSTNLDLTRLSLLPNHTAMPFETEDASLRVVVAISSSVHEFMFAYNCLRHALLNLQEIQYTRYNILSSVVPYLLNFLPVQFSISNWLDKAHPLKFFRGPCFTPGRSHHRCASFGSCFFLISQLSSPLHQRRGAALLAGFGFATISQLQLPYGR